MVGRSKRTYIGILGAHVSLKPVRGSWITWRVSAMAKRPSREREEWPCKKSCVSWGKRILPRFLILRRLTHGRECDAQG